MEDAPKILVIRMSSLGDIILTAPVLRNIKKRWPKAHITILVKPQFAAAAAKNPFISDILPFANLFSTLKAIKVGNYDMVLDLHANPRSRLLSLLSGIPVKARYKKDSLARRMFVNFRIPSPSLEKHTLERYLEALEKIDVPVVYREPLMGDWTLEERPPVLKSGRKKLLLLQTAFLGDAVLTLPLLEKIREVMPDCDITVMARPETAEIFASSRLADQVITDNKKTAPSFWREFFRLRSEMLAGDFDIAVVPHRSFRSALLTWTARIPIRIGFDASAGSFLFTHRVPFSWLIHDVERNMTLIMPLVGGAVPQSASHFPSLKEKSGVLGRLGHGAEKPFIGANPGSVWPTKRWPKEHWARLIGDLARTYDTKVLIVGGANEVQWNSEIEAAAGPGTCINLTGKTGMDDLMALIKNLKVFITNDSGPMHIAVAFGVPVTAIFGPTTKELGFFPYGKGNTVLEEQLECRPCALHGSKTCPRGHFLCMKLITPDKVLGATKKMLSAAGIPERS